MNPEIKTKWVTALRSGEFEQGRSQLRRGNTFCCLGVLCELYRRTTGNGEWLTGGYFLGVSDVLSPIVRDWAGLTESNPVVSDGAHCSASSLAEKNDTGASFSEIADIIDAEL